MNNTPLSIQLCLEEKNLCATIDERRSDVLETFRPLPETQRVALAHDAWTIGLRAVMNAYRGAEESKLKDIGKALVEDVDAELEVHLKRQQQTVVDALQRYFDPRDGQVVTRIDGFLKDGGELTRAMEKYLGPEHGALASILAKTLGENSPLLRRLSPTDSEGVIAVIEARVREALDANRAAMANALDPLAPDGAVARFLASLKKDLEKADSDRTKQLVLATKALDANDKTSLLSRLVEETHAARTAVVTAMNADAPDSPLAILKTSLTTMLEKHARTHAEVMAGFDERQRKLDLDLREVVARLEERKRGNAKAPQGGNDFESDVCRFTHSALHGAPVFIEDTGASTGAIKGKKKGDQVVRFNKESIYRGAALVIEAKHKEGFTIQSALAELEAARTNRMAQAGLFVLARSHATHDFPAFRRYGNDVLVIWDETDPNTDPYLHAALMLGLSLATRDRRSEDPGDIQALTKIEGRIEAELKRHTTMRACLDRMEKSTADLGNELRIGSNAMVSLLKDAKSTLRALNVELTTVEEERAAPLVLPAPNLGDVRASLSP